MLDVTTNAKWTKDCCDKQDLDFGVVNCYTRYYPDNTAICGIVMFDNFCVNSPLGEDPYVYTDLKPITLMESPFLNGVDEADTKQKVRDWYNNNMIEVLERALLVLKEHAKWADQRGCCQDVVKLFFTNTKTVNQ